MASPACLLLEGQESVSLRSAFFFFCAPGYSATCLITLVRLFVYLGAGDTECKARGYDLTS